MDDATKAINWFKSMLKIRNQYLTQAARGRNGAYRQMDGMDAFVRGALADVQHHADKGHEQSREIVDRYNRFLETEEDEIPF